MTTILKTKTLLLMLLIICKISLGQSTPTLELTNRLFAPGQGPSVTPVIVPFELDAINNNMFGPYAPALTLTVSLQNQIYTGLTYSNISTGLVFGGSPSLSSEGPIQQVTPNNIYDILGAYNFGSGGPTSNMFTSSPSASGANLGTGFDIDGNGFGNGVNAGVELFTAAQVLYDGGNAKDGRYEFGELVLTFNRPVKNPVIHLAGLGGSYRYLPFGQVDVPANYKTSYFSSELELQNSGLTSTKLSGNSFMTLVGNNVFNNAVKPNGGSVFVATDVIDNYGAATGSIRINGNVTQLVYKIFLRGSAASDMNFSTLGSNVTCGTTTCPHNPFTGDQWYVSASLDKPTQQISGNVFVDRDGLSDNNINKSAGVDNPKTNIGGTLYANLLNSSGLVVASTLVSSDGSYLFDAVPLGTYSVQLTTNASAGTYATPVTAPATLLPTGWANTGEFVGNTAGSDGTVNGKSSSVVVGSSDIKTEVNFGIERLPESVNFTILIPNPPINTVVTFDGSSPYFLTPLAGSDPEDLPTTTSLTGRTVRIDSLPSNSQLLYNGLPITLGQTITNYNISLLQIKFTQSIPSNGKTAFKYSFIDAAGFADPTPATYTIIPNNGSLFFSLTDFTVSKNNCVANLNWKTSSEINSEKFEVEVSADINATFVTKGTIAASTNSSITKNYQFNFSMETGVQYFFRLKMINKDGTFTYSEIRKLSCTDPKTQIAIAPNPVIDMFNISGMEKGKNTILIYSNDGKLIKSQVTGTTTYNVDISNFSAGLYMVRILNENGSNTTKRIVKK